MASWTVCIGVPAVVVSVLTLGMLRRRLIRPVARAWSLPLIWVSGVTLEVRGREHLQARVGRVVTFNHTSYADTFFIAAIAPDCFVPLVKREFRWVPVLGQVFWALGAAWVRRGTSKEALRTVTDVAHWLSDEGYTAFVAPEGTRSKNGELQRFKRGALLMAQKSGVPLVPVVFHGAHGIMRPGDWQVGRGRVVVDIHPPRTIAPGEDVKQATQRLQDDYAQWLAAGPDAQAVDALHAATAGGTA